MKKNIILIHAMTWMNLEKIILRDGRYKRQHILRFHIYEVLRTGISIGIESKLVSDGGKRRTGTANRFGVMGFPIGAMEMF